MNIFDTKQIKTLFGAALDVEPDQLNSFLTRACNGDEEVKEEVLSLLSAYRSASGFIEPVESVKRSLDPSAQGDQSDDRHLDRINWLMLKEQPGDSIDRYKLLDVIGEGGYGVVFRAEQQKPIRRIVALKLIKSSMESDPIRLLFETERQTLALMDHPNIAKLFDAGTTAEGRPYFVMELVLGIQVTRYCDRQRLSVRQRVALFVTICRAVHHAHQKGIIHRDLKPSNILVADSDGNASPKVIDFGVSQLISDSDNCGDDQLVLGTPRYMSPEQVSSANGALDIRSDVYSLGAVLYEILCGVPAVESDDDNRYTIAEVKRLFTAHPIALPSIRLRQLDAAESLCEIATDRRTTSHALPPLMEIELDCILMKALHRSRNSRYDSVAAMAEDLQRYLDRRPVSAAPSTVAYIGRRFFDRNKTIVILSLMIATSILGSLYAVTVSLIRIRAARDRAITAEQVIVKSEADAVEKLRKSYLEQAKTGERSRWPGQRVGSLEAISLAAQIRSSPDLRNEAIACMSLPDVELIQQWDSPKPGSFLFQDVKMERYAVADEKGKIGIYRTADRAQVCVLPGEGYPIYGGIFFSPDGRYLSVSYLGTAIGRRIWDLQSQRPVFETQLPAATDFSHDSNWFAVAKASGSIEIHSLLTGETFHSIPVAGDIELMSIQPGDQAIAVYGEAAGIRVISMKSGSSQKIQTSETAVDSIAWHPNGQQLAIGGHEPLIRIEIVNVNSGQAQTQMQGHVLAVTKLAFTHDGRFLLSCGWDSRIRLWDTAWGSELLSFAGLAGDFQLSDDNRICCNGEANTQMWRLITSQECTAVDGVSQDGSIISSDFSPDGSLLAGATQHGIRIWNVRSGQSISFVSCPGPRTVLFDPEGKTVLASIASGIARWKISDILGRDDQTLPRVTERLTGAMAITPDGGKILFGNSDGTIRVGTPDQIQDSMVIGRHSAPPRFASISPDGHWGASSRRYEHTFKVWNLLKGSLATELPAGAGNNETAQVAFSPDGKFLITGDSISYDWYSIGNWRHVHRLERQSAATLGLIAFSPDGKMLALSGPEYSTLLVDPVTGRELAKLDTQIPHLAGSISFSRDSTQLAITGSGVSITIWHLPLIRRKLSSMTLDWN